MIAGSSLFAGGCAPTDPEDQKPLKPKLVFGIAGSSMGQFNYPRGIAVDGQRELVYIVDKSARIQKFTREGRSLGCWGTHGRKEGQLFNPWALVQDKSGKKWLSRMRSKSSLLCVQHGKKIKYWKFKNHPKSHS